VKTKQLADKDKQVSDLQRTVEESNANMSKLMARVGQAEKDLKEVQEKEYKQTEEVSRLSRLTQKQREENTLL